jgi:nucleoside-diphosphate-sugar epimerase
MSRTVIVTGASGLVGSAAVDSFLNAGWEVIAVSRRRPEIISQRPFTHLPVDLQDAEACRRAFGALPEATHVFYAAVYEKPGLIAGWRDPEQMATNLSMIRKRHRAAGRQRQAAACQRATGHQGLWRAPASHPHAGA